MNKKLRDRVNTEIKKKKKETELIERWNKKDIKNDKVENSSN